MTALLILHATVLAAAFLGAGVMKLAGAEFMRDGAARLGLPYPAFRRIGVLEVAAAAGLVIGFAWRPLMIAAAGGLCCLMIGALHFHRRAHDPTKEFVLPAGLLVVAVATILLAAIG